MNRHSEALASAIEERCAELGIGENELRDLTGLSRQGFTNVRRGLIRDYQERTTGPLCKALRWRHDSVSRLLQGLPAVPLDVPKPPIDSGGLDQIREQLARMIELVVMIGEQVTEQGDAVAHLARRVSQQFPEASGGPQ